MNTNIRFCRVVMAASLGAVLWAGCASPEQRWSDNTRSVATRPVDLLKRSPDTHPERWVGFYPYETVQSSSDSLPVATTERGGVLYESAGAEPLNHDDIEAYRKELAEQACRQVGLR